MEWAKATFLFIGIPIFELPPALNCLQLKLEENYKLFLAGAFMFLSVTSKSSLVL